MAQGGARMGRRAWGALALAWLALAGLGGCASGPREPDPDAFITGVALARERIHVPPGALFEALLLDVSQADAPATVLGRQRIDPAGQAPFGLRIPYHSARVHAQGRYAVRATVTLEGRLLFVSDGLHPALLDPALRRVDVILQRVVPTRATVQAEVPLLQTYWKLAGIGNDAPTPVGAPSEGAPQAHLVLQADAPRVTGSGGCNRFLGDYALEPGEGRLAFASLTSTLRLCLDGGRSEGAYLQALRGVRAYVQQGRELLLKDEEGQALLRFEAVELGVPPPVEDDPPMLPQ